MSAEIEPGGPMTAEKLDEIAGWLDTYDAMAQLWLRGIPPLPTPETETVLELTRIAGSTEVQDDLRRWANEMRTAADATNSSLPADLPVAARSGSEGTATADEPPNDSGPLSGWWPYKRPISDFVEAPAYRSPWPAPEPGTHESDLQVAMAGLFLPSTGEQWVRYYDEYDRARKWSRRNAT